MLAGKRLLLMDVEGGTGDPRQQAVQCIRQMQVGTAAGRRRAVGAGAAEAATLERSPLSSRAPAASFDFKETGLAD